MILEPVLLVVTFVAFGVTFVFGVKFIFIMLGFILTAQKRRQGWEVNGMTRVLVAAAEQTPNERVVFAKTVAICVVGFFATMGFGFMLGAPQLPECLQNYPSVATSLSDRVRCAIGIFKGDV